jgi:hypothetical protein
LAPAALAALAFYGSALPRVQNPNLLLTGLIITTTLAAFIFLICRRVWRRAGGIAMRPTGAGWQAKAGAKVSSFVRDMHRSFALYWHRGHQATLIYAFALTVVYWAFRLSIGPLALIAVGWSGDWLCVVVAQLLLLSFVLPFAPTPGGGGARELGLAVLLSGYVPEGQLLSGLIVYTALSHWLPLIVSSFFAGHELSQGIFRRGGRRKAAYREGHTEAITGVLPAVTPTTPPQRHVSSGSTEREESRPWQPSKVSSPTDRMLEGRGHENTSTDTPIP